MPGVVLRFNDDDHNKIIKIYNKINTLVGEKIINIDQLPHVSLIRIQKDFTQKTVDKIDKILDKSTLIELDIELCGLGMFKIKEDKYVLYIKPIFNETFQTQHARVWKLLNKNVDLLDEEKYSPKSFTPHITVPLFKSNKKNVLKVMYYLMDFDLRFHITSNKISFINTSKETGNIKIHTTKKLTKIERVSS